MIGLHVEVVVHYYLFVDLGRLHALGCFLGDFADGLLELDEGGGQFGEDADLLSEYFHYLGHVVVELLRKGALVAILR